MLDVDTITTIQSIVHFITDVVLCFFFTFILNWLVFQKRERKLKYKRCLNNAWWCRKSSNAYAWNASNHRGWKIAEYYDKKAELYRKWHKRWLELAQKFKEAK